MSVLIIAVVVIIYDSSLYNNDEHIKLTIARCHVDYNKNDTPAMQGTPHISLSPIKFGDTCTQKPLVWL